MGERDLVGSADAIDFRLKTLVRARRFQKKVEEEREQSGGGLNRCR